MTQISCMRAQNRRSFSNPQMGARPGTNLIASAGFRDAGGGSLQQIPRIDDHMSSPSLSPLRNRMSCWPELSLGLWCAAKTGARRGPAIDLGRCVTAIRSSSTPLTEIGLMRPAVAAVEPHFPGTEAEAGKRPNAVWPRIMASYVLQTRAAQISGMFALPPAPLTHLVKTPQYSSTARWVIRVGIRLAGWPTRSRKPQQRSSHFQKNPEVYTPVCKVAMSGTVLITVTTGKSYHLNYRGSGFRC